jgi:UDP-N-acetyl-D-galactosamine dehydrogenase
LRETKRIVDIVWELADFGCKDDVYDPWAGSEDVKHEYGFPLVGEDAIRAGGYDVKSFLDSALVDGRL